MLQVRPHPKSGFYLDEVKYLPVSKIILETLGSGVKEYLNKEIDEYYPEVQRVIKLLNSSYKSCECVETLPFKHIRTEDLNPHVAFCNNCGRPWLHVNYTVVGKLHAYLIGADKIYFWNVSPESRRKVHQQAVVTCMTNGKEIYAVYDLFSGAAKNQDNFFAVKRS